MDERFAAYWARAEEMDKWDSLKSFREQFFIPPGTVYMDGNSLGLPPKAAEDTLEKTFGEWRDLAIGGWLEGTPPWFHLAEEAGRKMAPLMGASPDEVVMSCGSGVSACHNLLAMEIAGLHGGRLYAGSWSEWCSDPARPMIRREA